MLLLYEKIIEKIYRLLMMMIENNGSFFSKKFKKISFFSGLKKLNLKKRSHLGIFHRYFLQEKKIFLSLKCIVICFNRFHFAFAALDIVCHQIIENKLNFLVINKNFLLFLLFSPFYFVFYLEKNNYQDCFYFFLRIFKWEK